MVAATSQTLNELLDLLVADLGLTEHEVASALGVPTDAIECWRRGDLTPDREPRERLGQLVALHRHLHETIAPEEVAHWLRWTPHYLGGITPADAIARGQSDRVEALLTIIDYGIFT